MLESFYQHILLLSSLFGFIFFFKSIYLKFVVFIFFYPLIVLFCVKFGIPLSGIITVVGLNYFTDSIIAHGYWWAISGYLVFVFTLWGIRNKTIQFEILRIDAESRLVLLIFHFLSALVSYPRAFHLGDDRFNLLPGGGWASIYSLFSILIILSARKKYSIVDLLHLIITLFVIAGGERADSILIIMFMLVYRGDEVKKEIKLSFKFLVASTFGTSMLLLVGELRHKALDYLINNYEQVPSLMLRLLARSFYNQQTVTDTVHVYLSTVWGYFNEKGNLITLINTPFTVLPGTPFGGAVSPYYYQQLIFEYIENKGGGLFYSEGALNFGLIGVMIYAFIFGMIVKKTLTSTKLFGHLAFVTLFILQMRVQWYGLLYLMKPLVLLYLFTLLYDLSREGHFQKN